MKKILLFLCFSTTLFAQKNIFRAGVGSAFFGSGDLRGTHLSVEYQREIKQYFSIGGEVSMARGSSSETNVRGNQKIVDYSHNSANKANINLYFNLLNTDEHLVQFGTGASYRFGERYYKGGYSLLRLSNGQDFYGLSSEDIRKQNEIGYLINVGYTYKFNQKFNIHLKGSHQRYIYNADTYLGGGFGVMF